MSIESQKPEEVSFPLWVDQPDALGRVEARLAGGDISQVDAQHLRQFIEQGFVIIPGAISPEHVDLINRDIDTMHNTPERYLVKYQGKQFGHPASADLPDKCRILDMYVPSEASLAAILADPITHFLSLVYGQPPLAFQTLTFLRGSEQSMHKDISYVVVDKPLTLTASWIALEDVKPGSGELMYYPGSHRDKVFLFKDKHIAWNPNRDGKVTHVEYLDFIKRAALLRGVNEAYFLPKKGDALIWHANLAHGGAPITDSASSRRSLVTHYCAYEGAPNYASVSPVRFFKRPFGQGYYSSKRYDLAETDHPERPWLMG